MNRRVLAAVLSGGGALLVAAAFAGGYDLAHARVVTRVVTRTLTPAAVTHTQVRVVTRTVRPSPSAALPSSAPAAAVTFACKVEQTGGGAEEYEVTTAGGAAYAGAVEVSFYDYAGSGDTFPPASLAGVAPAGSAANWHPVPAGDIGASAEPSGCIAQAAG
ncbi:MAG TPA: hypothetical protein VGH27_09795 [Streptosporangiaceae bacterium]